MVALPGAVKGLPSPDALDPMTTPACLFAAAAVDPDLEAVVDGEVRLSYADLAEQVLQFASALVAHDVAAGDRVALWAPNSARWIIAALGTHTAGAVLSPVNTRFRGDEARYVVGKVRASLVVLDDTFLGGGYLDMLRGPGADPSPDGHPVAALPSVHTVVTMDAGADPAIEQWADFLARGTEDSRAEAVRRLTALRGSDVADILFTSGTTGFPKGAMASHYSDVVVDQAWGDMAGLRRADRYLLVNPLFHSFGYRAGLFASLIKRATMITVPTFDITRCLELVAGERITVFPGAPTVYTSILEREDRADYDLSSVRLAVTGATIVPVPLLHRMRDDLGFSEVITAYGLTETCGTATVCPPDTDLERISTSSGIAVSCCEVRISGLDGAVLPAGQHGEIQVRGDNVMLGYFEDEAATAAAIDSDGWLHTGDVGRLDDDGYLYITDRLKDVFVVGGFNVYPAEVERVLREHPSVSDVAVVGVPDERMGEVGMAYVQTVPEYAGDADALPGDLVAWAKDRLANFKVPRRIELVVALPRTASGKVQKHRLAADA